MDLSTQYLGIRLKNPLVVGACGLATDVGTARKLEEAGASMIVMHSLFEEQFAAERVAANWSMEHGSGPDPDAEAGLPSFDEFKLRPDQYFEHLATLKRTLRIPVVGSINGVTPGNWVNYAREMERAGADAVELNVYDPTMDVAVTGGEVERRLLEVTKLVRRAVKIPLSVKLSPFYSSIANVAKLLDEAGVDGLVLFNRFYQPDINIHTMEAYRTLRLSTPDELLLRLRWTAALHGKVRCGIAVTGGVHSGSDVIKSVLVGAHAVQLTSCILEHGVNHLAAIVHQVEAWMRTQKLESLAAVCGKMSVDNAPDRAAFERVNYVNILAAREQAPT